MAPWLSASQQHVRDTLLLLVEARAGVFLVTGESGAGKSDFVAALAAALRAAGHTVTACDRSSSIATATSWAGGTVPVLVWDDADLLSRSMLRALQRQLGPEADDDGLRVVLVGRPILQQQIRALGLARLRRRVRYRGRIEPLGALEAADIPAFIAQVTGHERIETRLAAAVATELVKHTAGKPTQVASLWTDALQLAREAGMTMPIRLDVEHAARLRQRRRHDAAASPSVTRPVVVASPERPAIRLRVPTIWSGLAAMAAAAAVAAWWLAAVPPDLGSSRDSVIATADAPAPPSPAPAPAPDQTATDPAPPSPPAPAVAVAVAVADEPPPAAPAPQPTIAETTPTASQLTVTPDITRLADSGNVPPAQIPAEDPTVATAPLEPAREPPSDVPSSAPPAPEQPSIVATAPLEPAREPPGEVPSSAPAAPERPSTVATAPEEPAREPPSEAPSSAPLAPEQPSIVATSPEEPVREPSNNGPSAAPAPPASIDRTPESAPPSAPVREAKPHPRHVADAPPRSKPPAERAASPRRSAPSVEASRPAPALAPPAPQPAPPAVVATAPPLPLRPNAPPAPAPAQVASAPPSAAAGQPRCEPYVSKIDFAGRPTQARGLACRDAAGHWWLMNQRME